jgi:hypothetical protein
MDQMSDTERLVAIDDIKRLKSRRDRAVDTKDYATLEALHAPDHKTEGHATWNSAKEMVENIRAAMVTITSCHHCHTPDITFQSPTKAAGIWAMEDNLFWKQGDEDHWLHGMGFYHETYEKRGGQWVFTSRRLKRLRVNMSPGAVMPGPFPQGR